MINKKCETAANHKRQNPCVLLLSAANRINKVTRLTTCTVHLIQFGIGALQPLSLIVEWFCGGIGLGNDALGQLKRFVEALWFFRNLLEPPVLYTARFRCSRLGISSTVKKLHRFALRLKQLFELAEFLLEVSQLSLEFDTRIDFHLFLLWITSILRFRQLFQGFCERINTFLDLFGLFDHVPGDDFPCHLWIIWLLFRIRRVDLSLRPLLHQTLKSLNIISELFQILLGLFLLLLKSRLKEIEGRHEGLFASKWVLFI